MNSPVEAGSTTEWTLDRMLSDIESLIRREGHRQYSSKMDEGVYLAQLCGVSAHLVRKTGIVRLFTHDMDIAVNVAGEMTFVRGSAMLLRAHHRNLCAYRRAISATITPAHMPTSEQAA